jgi:hypothetical protein
MIMHYNRQKKSYSIGSHNGRTKDSIRQAINLVVSDDHILLSLGECLDRHLGLSVRRGQAVRLINTILRPFGDMEWPTPNHAALRWTPSPAQSRALLDSLATKLTTLATKPLTPKELMSVMPMTNAERMRWTKDGRLPKSGAAMIKRGQQIPVSSYSVNGIEKLLLTPDIMSKWRAEPRMP